MLLHRRAIVAQTTARCGSKPSCLCVITLVAQTVLQLTGSAGDGSPGDAFIAALVHAPFGHVVRSSSPRALLGACGYLLAIRPLGRHTAAPFGGFAV